MGIILNSSFYHCDRQDLEKHTKAASFEKFTELGWFRFADAISVTEKIWTDI
jgi:hypothetical protein